MKRRGFTYIGTLFSSLTFAAAFAVLMKAASLTRDTEKMIQIKKELAMSNLSVIEEIEERLQSGEQIELNNYSTENTKVKITADENSAAYLISVKSERSGISANASAVLFAFEEG